LRDEAFVTCLYDGTQSPSIHYKKNANLVAAIFPHKILISVRKWRFSGGIDHFVKKKRSW
jgi:hypothetical protein